MAYELEPVLSNVKSYYHKAVVINEVIGHPQLLSFKKKIIELDTYSRKIVWVNTDPNVYTETTMRHVRDFLHQNNMRPLTKKDMLELASVFVNAPLVY